MKKIIHIFAIIIMAWFTMGATGCQGDSSSSTGAASIRIDKVDNGSTVNITPSGEGGYLDDGEFYDIPPCDGTSPTAEAEDRCY